MFDDLTDEEFDIFNKGISVEKQAVTEKHEFLEKLMGFDQLYIELMNHCIDKPDLSDLNEEIYHEMCCITDGTNDQENITKDLRHFHVIPEEEKIKDKLAEDVEHKNWRAVRTDIREDLDTKEEFIRAEKESLDCIHKRFIHIMRLMKEKLEPALAEITNKSIKEKNEETELYYFRQVYGFFRTYERIFRHLIRKERYLLREEKELMRKIKSQ